MYGGFDFSFPAPGGRPDIQPRPVAWCALSESDWEDYAMGLLTEQKTAALEEHLLICVRCQDQLARVDEYIEVVETASALVAAGPADHGASLSIATLRKRLAKPLGAAAAAATLLLWLD